MRFITLMGLLILCSREASAESPAIVKLGTVACDMVEATPLVWQGRLLRFEYVREGYKENTLGKPYFRIVDVEKDGAGAPFAVGYSLGSAFVDGNRMYVYGVSPWGADSIHVFSSPDLTTWDEQTALRLPGWQLFNESVCKDAEGYSMALEVGGPADIVGTPFTMFFARSKNLLNWTLAPVTCAYDKTRYTACPALRYYDGMYYMVYLGKDAKKWYYAPEIARSKDLATWEKSPLCPIMQPGPEDKKRYGKKLTPEELKRIDAAEDINNSDLDFCEFGGKVVICYSWGNQKGEEFFGAAEAPGTEREFLEGWFPK